MRWCMLCVRVDLKILVLRYCAYDEHLYRLYYLEEERSLLFYNPFIYYFKIMFIF